MRGEKHAGAHLARLPHHGVELLLVEWIETAGRLVHDEELRPAHEADHQRQLLLVAAAVVAEAERKVQLKPVGELLQVLPVHAASYRTQIGYDLPAAQAAKLRQHAGQK